MNIRKICRRFRNYNQDANLRLVRLPSSNLQKVSRLIESRDCSVFLILVSSVGHRKDKPSCFSSFICALLAPALFYRAIWRLLLRANKLYVALAVFTFAVESYGRCDHWDVLMTGLAFINSFFLYYVAFSVTHV